MKLKFKLMFAWYDFWVGLFWDKKKKVLYIFPLPTLGVKITVLWWSNCVDCLEWHPMTNEPDRCPKCVQKAGDDLMKEMAEEFEDQKRTEI